MKITLSSFKKPLAVLLFSLFSISSFAADITVSHDRIRAVPEGQLNSAAFMVFKNNSTEDRLLISAHSNISKAVELHTHKKEGGMMRMRRVDSIAIKAGSKTTLQPGGLHIMFIGLTKGLKVGEKIELKLVFDNSSELSLSVPVKMVAGMGMHKKDMHKKMKNH